MVFTKSNMISLFRNHPENYLDCGEVDCTKLAEDACHSDDGYDEDGNIPEKYFEMAVDIEPYVINHKKVYK